MENPKTARLGFWLTTSFFSLLIAFTAYNELASSQVAEVFAHLGFPSYAFRLELSVAKILGVLALLLPVPAQV
jgi:putative oxidoreductase